MGSLEGHKLNDQEPLMFTLGAVLAPGAAQNSEGAKGHKTTL